MSECSLAGLPPALLIRSRDLGVYRLSQQRQSRRLVFLQLASSPYFEGAQYSFLNDKKLSTILSSFLGRCGLRIGVVAAGAVSRRVAVSGWSR